MEDGDNIYTFYYFSTAIEGAVKLHRMIVALMILAYLTEDKAQLNLSVMSYDNFILYKWDKLEVVLWGQDEHPVIMAHRNYVPLQEAQDALNFILDH